MSLANKFDIPPALFDTIKKMNEEKKDYDAKVKALMAKRGIKSIADLSPEEKKDFFNTLDSMHKAKNEEVELDEGKSGTGYELYHKDFSSAMQHAYDFAKKKYNIEIDPTEIDRNVAMGPRKPGSGKANAYRLLDKTGKKAIQVQVANLDNKRYELNMYKEEVELEEGKYGAFRTGPKRPKSPHVPQGDKDPRTGLPLGFSHPPKKDEPKKVKEEVELTESHFEIGDDVICKDSGMEGEVVKIDEPQTGKYYTVKREDGKMVKYAPDELKAEDEDEEEDEKEMKESDASYAAGKEKEKEDKLTPSDKDKLAKIRAMMGKEKKPMKEEFDIQEASGTEVKKDAKSQMDSAKISMQMVQLKLKQASEREALQRKKASIREEAEELDEGMSAAQIKKLRDAYGNIEKIDVSGQPYKNLVAFLDKQDLKTLKMLAGAKIKFISPLAQNRVVRKMNESIGSTVGRAIGQYAGAKMGLEGPGGAHGEILGRQLEMFARALLKKLTKEEVEEFNEISADVAKRVAQRRDQDFRKNTPTDTQKRRMGRGDWRADPQLHADRAEKSAIKRGAKDVHGYNESYNQLFAEAAKKMSKKKEATSADNNKSVKSGDKLSGKQEPIEIDPEIKE